MSSGSGGCGAAESSRWKAELTDDLLELQRKSGAIDEFTNDVQSRGRKAADPKERQNVCHQKKGV